MGSTSTADVVVIGGGIIGCMAAYELSQAGLQVALLERGQIGQEASSASGGQLVPLHLAADGETSPLFEFHRASTYRFDELVLELEDASGVRMGYERSGVLRVAEGENERDRLKQTFTAWQRTVGMPVSWLDVDEVHRLEPGLGPNVLGGIFSPDERTLSSARFVEALGRILRARGMDVREGTPATGIRHHEQQVHAVETPQGEIQTPELVLAAGAWTGLCSQWFGLTVPITPMRGQMVAVRPRTPILGTTTVSYNGAITPRPDGTVTAGSTYEDVGFDDHTTVEGIRGILQTLPRLVPALADATFVRAWSGLRPWTSDGLPVVGRLPGWTGVTFASGHGKHGISGAPATGSAVRQLIIDDQAGAVHDVLSPARFVEAQSEK
jgi:glycine oxidase